MITIFSNFSQAFQIRLTVLIQLDIKKCDAERRDLQPQAFLAECSIDPMPFEEAGCNLARRFSTLFCLQIHFHS